MPNYPILEMSRLKKIHPTKIAVQWEEAKETHLEGKLLRPETHRGVHYTGHVFMIGEDVCLPPLKKGDRILFSGLANSQMDKYDDPEKGRWCLIDESDAMAIVPERVKVFDKEGDYNFDI